MTISLPASMKKFVERQAARHGYQTADKYLQKIIKDVQRSRKALDAELKKALDSPRIEMTDEFWRKLEEELFETNPELRPR